MSRKPRQFHFMYWITLFFFLLFKVSGLATFSISSHASKKKYSEVRFLLTPVKSGVIYNLLLSCLMVGSNFITIPYKYETDYFGKSAITTIIEIFQGILGTLMICTVAFCYCVNQSSLVKIGNQLIRIEAELRQLRQPINRTRAIRLLIAVYLFQLGLFIAVLIADSFAFNADLKSWLTDCVPTMFAGCVFIQYFLVLTLIKAVFANVNRTIQSLCRNWSSDDHPESLCRPRRLFISSSTIQSILQFRDIHDHLCDVSADVSEFYSLPSLICVFFIFFTLLYNTYYLMEPLIVDNMIVDVVILSSTIFWIVFLLYPIILLTTKITNTVNEVDSQHVRELTIREQNFITFFFTD